MKSDLSKKSILIVGANGAMAIETIKTLLKDGAENITMAVRSQVKGEAAKQEILKNVKAKPSILKVVDGFDMNKPENIKVGVQNIVGRKAFDIVFLAAGFAVFTDDYQSVSWNGKKVEKNVFQNMMGSHFTLQELKENNLLQPKARVVIAGGEGSRGIKGLIEKPKFESVKEFRDYIYIKKNPKYSAMNAIGVSKLTGAFWTSKMAELEKDLEVIWFSPGLTSGSSGLDTLPPLKKWIMNNVMFRIFSWIGQAQTPDHGGRKYADVLEGKIGVSGDILGAPEGKSIGKITNQKPMNSLFTDQAYIDEFWTILQEVFSEKEDTKLKVA
jgi:NAD(P)-dependent dehydrogenase (short-subunit alcohol dehydrogenase family)